MPVNLEILSFLPFSSRLKAMRVGLFSWGSKINVGCADRPFKTYLLAGLPLVFDAWCDIDLFHDDLLCLDDADDFSGFALVLPEITNTLSFFFNLSWLVVRVLWCEADNFLKPFHAVRGRPSEYAPGLVVLAMMTTAFSSKRIYEPSLRLVSFDDDNSLSTACVLTVPRGAACLIATITISPFGVAPSAASEHLNALPAWRRCYPRC